MIHSIKNREGMLVLSWGALFAVMEIFGGERSEESGKITGY